MSQEVTNETWVIPRFSWRCIPGGGRSSVIDIKDLHVFYEEFYSYQPDHAFSNQAPTNRQDLTFDDEPGYFFYRYTEISNGEWHREFIGCEFEPWDATRFIWSELLDLANSRTE
jgi:hypothetical protein